MTSYIDQLKSQRETLTTFLQTQQSSSHPASPGLRITMQIYTHILEDALSVLNSIIQYLTPESNR